MTKRRNTIQCPACGAPAVHEVRTATVEYKGHKAPVKVQGHRCGKCCEAVLHGDALEKRERAYLDLRAKLEEREDDPEDEPAEGSTPSANL